MGPTDLIGAVVLLEEVVSSRVWLQCCRGEVILDQPCSCHRWGRLQSELPRLRDRPPLWFWLGCRPWWLYPPPLHCVSAGQIYMYSNDAVHEPCPTQMGNGVSPHPPELWQCQRCRSIRKLRYSRSTLCVHPSRRHHSTRWQCRYPGPQTASAWIPSSRSSSTASGRRSWTPRRCLDIPCWRSSGGGYQVGLGGGCLWWACRWKEDEEVVEGSGRGGGDGGGGGGGRVRYL